MVKLTSLYSGSHGNCTLIQSAESNILVDAGFTYNTLKRYLNEVGLTPSDITAILITHEHGDHIGALSGWVQHNEHSRFRAQTVRSVGGEQVRNNGCTKI